MDLAAKGDTGLSGLQEWHMPREVDTDFYEELYKGSKE